MQVRFDASDPFAHDTPLLAVGVVEGEGRGLGELAALDERLGGQLTRLSATGDLSGRTRDEVLLYGSDEGPRRVLLLGMGAGDEARAEDVRKLVGRAVRTAERLGVARISALVPRDLACDPEAAAQAAAEAAQLAAWRFRELKSRDDDGDDDAPRTQVEDVTLFAADGGDRSAAVERGSIVGEAENFTRTLQTRPGNVATPTHIADEAVRMASEVGLDVTVYDEDALREAGMHAILAVSRGSDEEARLIVLEHRGGADGEAPLVLVGKGLSFDAGGISLKPPKGMEAMKFDMSGGAAVLGAMRAVARLGVKANVVGIVPSSENLPSGSALKPGDVIDTLAGKTVEVHNTDAEGRLILADALAHGASLQPAAMVDCATLTGAVVIGLGHHASAVLGNDDDVVEEVRRAGERSGERCWPLPLWPEYRKQLDSDTADLVNVGGRPAGTITAAAFLKEFVGDVPWAHLDIAGTAYGDAPPSYLRKGAQGVPTRLLVEWVRSRAG